MRAMACLENREEPSASRALVTRRRHWKGKPGQRCEDGGEGGGGRGAGNHPQNMMTWFFLKEICFITILEGENR